MLNPQFSCTRILRLVSSVCLLLLHLSAGVLEAEDYAVTLQTTPSGVQYGTWGPPAETPVPTLFILSGTIEETLGSSYFRQCGNELSEVGYLLVSIDLPCHGLQTQPGGPSGLGGWGVRVGKNEDIVAECNSRLSKVLDHLIETKVSDPAKIAICGTSRGGFLAIHFAAHDQRVKCAAGFAPVTDLAALREFREKKGHPLVHGLSLANQSEKLAGRPVWIMIGDRDERVGTEQAMDLALKLSAAAVAKAVPSELELHVVSVPQGHTTPRGASVQAAEWIQRHISTK